MAENKLAFVNLNKCDDLELWAKRIYDWCTAQSQEDMKDFLIPVPSARDYYDFATKFILLVKNQELALNDGRVPTTYWLVVSGGSVIGFVKTRRILDENTYHEGGNIRVAIDKDYRGQGLGKEAFLYAIKYLKSEGVKDIFVSTFVDNIVANRLIQTVGGKEESVGDSWMFPGHKIVRYWLHF